MAMPCFRLNFYWFPTVQGVGRALLSMQKDRLRENLVMDGPWDLRESPLCTGVHPVPCFLCSEYNLTLATMVQCVSQGRIRAGPSTPHLHSPQGEGSSLPVLCRWSGTGEPQDKDLRLLKLAAQERMRCLGCFSIFLMTKGRVHSLQNFREHEVAFSPSVLWRVPSGDVYI